MVSFFIVIIFQDVGVHMVLKRDKKSFQPIKSRMRRGKKRSVVLPKSLTTKSKIKQQRGLVVIHS